MLTSTSIQRRQSAIRETLAGLVGKETPTEDEIRTMTDLDREYQVNETKYRAALISEDVERKAAGADLAGREGRQ